MQFKKLSIIVLALVAIFAVMIPCVSATSADPALELAVATDVAPASETGLICVTAGQNINVTFSIAKNTGLCALEFDIAYDAEILDIVGKQANGSVEIFDAADIVSSPFAGGYPVKVDKNTGKVRVTIHIGETASAFTGDLFTLCFKVEKAEHAPTEITVDNVKAYAEYTSAGKIAASEIKIDGVTVYGHTFSDAQVVEPTCEEAGYSYVECTGCDFETKLDEVPALGHDEVVDAAVAATCTATGLTEGKHCKRCGEILVAQATVEALGHDEIIIEGVAPTIFAEGLTEGKKCARCGEVLAEQETIPALGIFAAWWFWVIIAVVVIAIVAIICVVVAKKKKAGKEA